MKDAALPYTKGLEAMSAVMRELTLQLSQLNSHFISASWGARREIDPAWVQEVQAQVAKALAEAKRCLP